MRAQRVVRTAERRGIVIAKHDYGTIVGVRFDQVEHANRIGAITDKIAEKRKAVRSQRRGVGKTGGDRLQIAMDIGEQG
jgi:hypothetical protein